MALTLCVYHRQTGRLETGCSLGVGAGRVTLADSCRNDNGTDLDARGPHKHAFENKSACLTMINAFLNHELLPIAVRAVCARPL